jgi:hypothetical protein
MQFITQNRQIERVFNIKGGKTMSEKKCPHCNKVAMEYNHWFKADVCKICGYRDPPIITNFDRIRSMNDEELARWLVDATVCERVCNEDEYCHGNECVKRVTDWLKQPAKEEHHEAD